MAPGDLILKDTLVNSASTGIRGLVCDPEWDLVIQLNGEEIESYNYDSDGQFSSMIFSDTVVGGVGGRGIGLSIDRARKLVAYSGANYCYIRNYSIAGVVSGPGWRSPFLDLWTVPPYYRFAMNSTSRLLVYTQGTAGIHCVRYEEDGTVLVSPTHGVLAGDDARGAAWDEGRRFLFVANTNRGCDSWTSTWDGVLTHVSNSNPGGQAACEVVVDPEWRLVFVPCRVTGIQVFSYGDLSPVLSYIGLVGTYPGQGQWAGITIDTVNKIIFSGGFATYSYTYDENGVCTPGDSILRVDTNEFSHAYGIDTTKNFIFEGAAQWFANPGIVTDTRSMLYEPAPASSSVPVMRRRRAVVSSGM